MSDDPKASPSASKARRVLYVANPGSDSERSGDEDRDRRAQYNHNLYTSPKSQSPYLYNRTAVTSPNNYPDSAKFPLPPVVSTTNLPSDDTHHYPISNPPLSSPSSTSSPAVESTPPPSTPGLSVPPLDLVAADPPLPIQEPTIIAPPQPPDRSEIPQVVHRTFIQKITSPFYQSTPQQNRVLPPRPTTSPTTSIPDSHSSPGGQSSTSTLADKVLIVVTADSERYLTVDITSATNPAFIRERIFTKLRIWDEEDQSKYSIYQTEIGEFAIGEALTDAKLFEFCRDRGDSKGSLKFFVSHSSAPVHEQLSSQSSQSSSSLSPTMTTIPPTIPPPVLPYGRSYAPLKPKRRSRSRPGSLSSASEHLPPEVAAGYEASVSDDGERDTRDNRDNRSIVRPPLPVPPQQHTNVSTPARDLPPSPRAVRRPSGPVPRPTSPFRPNSPPTVPPPLPPSDRTRTQGPEPSPVRDKYGHILPTSPPPHLSPNRTTFDDNSLTTPARTLHARSASDAAAEREQALQASENQLEQARRQWRLQDMNKQERPRDPSTTRVREKRTGDTDEPSDKVGRSDSWVVVPRETLRENSRGANKDQLPNSKELSRGSPARVPHRNRDNHVPTQRYKASPYATRPLAIPSPPRNPPPAPPGAGSSEPRVPSIRPAGQPVPANWTVTWKSAEKGDQKIVPAPSAQWPRIPKCMDKSKSMDNLRAAAVNLQPGGRRPSQLPMTGPNGSSGTSSGTHVFGDGRREPTGLPKSYDRGTSFGRRPYPIAGSSQNNYESSQSSLLAQYTARGPGLSPGLTSPSHEPYPPRPQSALGDPVASPTQRYQRNMQSPTYGPNFQDPDSVRSPRALSPNRQQFHGQGFGLRRSPHIGSSSYSDAYGGIETTRMPRSPASPRDNRSREKLNDHSEPSLSTIAASGRGDNLSGEPTLRQEDHGWIVQMLDGNSAESTIVPSGPLPQPLSAQSSELSPTTPHSESSVLEDDTDSDRDCGTSIWKKPPVAEEAARPKSILRRPPLKVETQTNGTPSSTPGFAPPTQPLVTPNRPPVPPVPAVPPVPQLSRGRAGERVSRFTDMRDFTWAPRPPPEDVYDHLEEFFPNHDLDKPVIEASSGGTSPTAVEYSAIPPLAPVNTSDKARVRGKKSIRIVAEEHKKRIDRNSRADLSSVTSVLRKRSTKLWGSRLEEVTTAQARTGFASSLPDSPSGAKPIFKWVRGELIGRGTYGRVYLALNATTGEMIAVKQVEMPRTASDKNDTRQVTVVQALKMESETLKDLDHPNIVQYLGFEETPNFLSIFLEYVPGGSIGSCLLKHGKFDEEVTKSFTAQILGGLEYLHSKGILHRDLKADNILVETSGVCKISDFGISKRTDDDAGGAHTAMQGTVFWMAPEVINTQKKGYNFKIDIWSVGCVVLEMWAGHRPWNGDEVVAVMFKLYQSKLPPPVPDDVVLSSLADDFRSKCFAINPEERPSASELRKHPYLTLLPGWAFRGFK